MKAIDIVLLLIILAIVGMAVAYIIKAKKNGAKCIGCPAGGSCASHKNGESCGCGCNGNGKQQCNCHADADES